MEIIKREKGEFGEIKIDFYLNKDRAILVTIEQLAQGFGYQSKRAVEKMLERNPYLREVSIQSLLRYPTVRAVPKKHVCSINEVSLKLAYCPELKKVKFSELGYMTISKN